MDKFLGDAPKKLRNILFLPFDHDTVILCRAMPASTQGRLRPMDTDRRLRNSVVKVVSINL
jgi:hypothetical protein